MVRAVAAPRFTLSPTSGNYTVGNNFSVTLGVSSDSEKVVAMDVVAGFDASKLEVVSIDKASNPAFQFAYDSNTAIIHNSSGKFEITLAPNSTSVYDGQVANGALLVVNFRAKAAGTASFTITCQSGSVTESNIINQASSDVVDCASNQSGSYTISASSSNTTSDPSSTPTPTVRATSTSTSELPRTGGAGSTVLLMLVGMASIASALVFKRW